MSPEGTRPSPRLCQICGTEQRAALRPAAVVRPALVQLIREQEGSWNPEGWICADDLQRARNRYVADLLRAEKGELSELETEVVESLREHEILSSNPDTEFEADLTFGERLADRVALFGGSWAFICLFAAVMLGWIGTNTYLLSQRPFDPYPFILLNLVLSCLAAIQAPIIMMSQNRQQARDRARADHDYQINLKAELEIRHLHQKVDHLLSHQWERLIEIQEIQMELMNELRSRR